MEILINECFGISQNWLTITEIDDETEMCSTKEGPKVAAGIVVRELLAGRLILKSNSRKIKLNQNE